MTSWLVDAGLWLAMLLIAVALIFTALFLGTVQWVP